MNDTKRQLDGTNNVYNDPMFSPKERVFLYTQYHAKKLLKFETAVSHAAILYAQKRAGMDTDSQEAIEQRKALLSSLNSLASGK